MNSRKAKTILGLGLAFLVGILFGFALNAVQTPFTIPETASPESASLEARTEAPQTEVTPEYQGQLSLFILAGQSNMSGRGNKMLPIGKQPHPRIFLFGNDYRWRLATEPVDDATDQVDLVSRDQAAGFSPGMPFALRLLDLGFPNPIGLIPCAKAGTPIAEWRRNLSDRSLYGSCLKRARAASPLGEITGILFFQGEADAVDPASSVDIERSPDTWGEEFTTWVRNFRGDLDQPNLPVVFAEISPVSDPERRPFRQQVKAQQRALRLPNSALISVDDLLRLEDDHFPSESYEMIGYRFAEAFWNLTETEWQSRD